MDTIDRAILRALQADATASYAELGRTVGLSAASTHDRVRKLRARGTIVRTTVEVDPVAVDRNVLAFVTLAADSWIGTEATRDLLAAVPEVESAYVVAGDASLLVKVRTSTNQRLQDVLRTLHDLPGVTTTRSTVVLETFFERPVAVDEDDTTRP